MIEISHLSKNFPGEEGEVPALRDVSLTIPDGDVYGIIGMSGAGKSTLVRCINGLERPTAGTNVVDGCDVSLLRGRALRAYRRQVSMIFQGFHLLMQKNCLQNVCFPLRLAGLDRREAIERGMELLDTVGLADKAHVYPAQLSGGQQQRVAIARAIATEPKILLCDEATSALDPTTASSILRLIREIQEKHNITVIIITHRMSDVEHICRHVAILDGGAVAEEGEVAEIFSRPRSDAARRLVFPQGEVVLPPLADTDARYIRVVFNGVSATSAPLIARMVKERDIVASIAAADTRSIGDRVYGSMILCVGDGRLAASAVEYLNAHPEVHAEEVTARV